MRQVFILVFGIMVSATLAVGADVYICPGATGAANGTEWTDAYTGIGTGPGNLDPASMVRGNTYWIANGQITSASARTTFGVADSGTSVIAIQKAIDGASGTNTGWTSGGTGACNASQAVWGPILFSTDYWIFNGATRNASDTSWKTGYGFKVIWASVITGVQGTIQVGQAANGYTCNKCSIQYVEVQGSGDTTGTYQDVGVWFSATVNYNNPYLGYSYIHNTGGCSVIIDDSVGGIIESNFLTLNQSTSANHAEGIAVRTWGCTTTGPCSSPTTDLTIRYNKMENIEGTAFIADPAGSGNWASGYYAIYGNILWQNTAELPAGYSATTGQAGISWFQTNWGTSGGTIHVYNNTMSNMRPQCDTALDGESGSFNLVEENNIWYGCNGAGGSIVAPTGSNITWSHNYYNDIAGGVTDPDPDKQVITGSSSNPFVNGGTNVAGANNFQLVADTNMWTALSSPYNLDLMGNTRTSSRGALQFGASGLSPAPPTGLAAVVQ